MSNILITICARGGSKGIPGKNIKIIAGKPLIAFTINIEKKFMYVCSSDLILSTVSHKIKEGKELDICTEYKHLVHLVNDKIEKPKDIKEGMLW